MTDLILTPAERQVVIERTEGTIAAFHVFIACVKADEMAAASAAWVDAVTTSIGVSDLLRSVLRRQAGPQVSVVDASDLPEEFRRLLGHRPDER